MIFYDLEKLVLGEILQEKAEQHNRETFLKFREGDLSYGEVLDAADRMTRGLAGLGVRRGVHVAIMLPNCAEFLYVTFALSRLGAVAVPINTAYKGEILLHVLQSSDASVLVVDESLLDPVARLGDEVTDLDFIIVRMSGSCNLSAEKLPWPATALGHLMGSRGEADTPRVRFNDLQAIMYTSGTTGPSKGVMTPHALALTCAQDSMHYLAYDPGETIYCPIPLFHAGALWDGVMTAMLAGGSIAVVERFSASRFWEDVRFFNANVAMGIFSMIPILMNQPPANDDRDHPLRAFYLGKSALDEAFRERFGVRSVETYTSTEVGIGTGSPYGQWCAGSCGQPNEAMFEVALVDEADCEVEVGQQGELVLRPKLPYVITPGYYNYPKATADAFRNLWFHTGDRARRDEDGYYFFVDRIKDCIRRRGENISAFEVEQAVNSHPYVVECAAFGVPSELEEEEVKVAVVIRDRSWAEAEDLLAHCIERLPSFMVPRYVEFVDELPKTPIGKLAKHELRARGDNGITRHTRDLEDRIKRLARSRHGQPAGGEV